MGKKLMEIKNSDEFNKARTYRYELGRSFWTGGNDLSVDGTYVWDSNGDLVASNYWDSGSITQSTSYSCLLLSTQGVYNYVCGFYAPYVCE